MRPLARRGAFSLTWPVFIFVAAALVPASQIWALLSTTLSIDPLAWLVDSLLPALGQIATPLIGAALLLRHPDAARRLRLVFVGAVLLAAEPILQQVVDRVARIIDPASSLDGPAITVFIAVAAVFSLVGTLGYVVLARGLSRARQSKDRRSVRFVDGAVLVVLIAFGLLLVSMLGSYGMPAGLDGTISTISSFGSLIVRVIAIGYLTASVSRGWIAGGAPRRAWQLAALGAWIMFVALPLSVAIGYVAGLVQVTDALTVFQVLAIAMSAGPVLLLAAFLDGLPDVDDITWYDLAELDAEGAGGAGDLDPFADGDDAAGVQLFELEDRRLDA